jgi:hypothetical protein
MPLKDDWVIGDFYTNTAANAVANAINTIHVNVLDSGADSTGGSGDLGAIITSLASSLHTSGGGTIYIPQGTYRFTTTGTVDSPKVNIIGDGSGVTKLVPAAGLGTSPCLDISALTTSSGDYGGKFGQFSIDGAATPSGVGMVYGDMIRGHLDDIFIDNYSTGKALRFLNRSVWTERTLITRLTLGNNNKIGWAFEVSGGTNSFGYTRALDCALNLDKIANTTTVASVSTTVGSTSATVTGGGYPGVSNGMSVDGVGLYSGTTVTNIVGNTLTLSIPASASGTNTLSFAANNQTGILLTGTAYLYNASLGLTVNAVGGVEGTSQSPVMIKVDDNSYLERMDFIIDAENTGGKVGAVWVGTNATFIGYGYTSFSDPFMTGNNNYTAPTGTGVVQLGGAAHFGFALNDSPAGNYSIGNNAWHALRARRYYESYDRFLISHDAIIKWGSGSVAVDTTLARASAGVLQANGNLIRGGANIVSVDTTLTADDYLNVLTGTIARTFTLPALAGNTGVEMVFKNRSTQILTIQRAGTDQIYDTGAVSSFTVAAGATAQVINDGTYWLKV